MYQFKVFATICDKNGNITISKKFLHQRKFLCILNTFYAVCELLETPDNLTYNLKSSHATWTVSEEPENSQLPVDYAYVGANGDELI